MKGCHRCIQDSLFWQTVYDRLLLKTYQSAMESVNDFGRIQFSEPKFKVFDGKCFEWQINKIYKENLRNFKTHSEWNFLLTCPLWFSEKINLYSCV